jgi:ABC-type Fe3+/spermidine/putrescine transport system ATPase subunit
MPEPADVELSDVTKRFGGVVAVEFLNLTIPARTYACLLGSSGYSQEEALALADLIVVMHRGRIEQCGTPRAVYNQPRTRLWPAL